jgi:5-methylcytosine-specific restriction endonuclease McrA
MRKYSRNKIIKELADTNTGEVKRYQEIPDWTRAEKSGWNKMYKSYLEEVILQIRGEKEIKILFYIFNSFTKHKREILLDQKKLAKKFDTTQPYISRILNKFVDMEILYIVNKTGKSKIYRLNPYLYIPVGENAVELQDEWDILTHAPKDNRDKTEYLEYLYSDEWLEKRKQIHQRDRICVRCGSNENLQVHHKTYNNLYNENLDDLELLCERCHQVEHLVP